jgi:hypothetical protein
MTATRDGNIYRRTESESESELDMSDGGMLRRMEENSKRIILESSNREAESETMESEWEETVNIARQRRVGTNQREDDPDILENQEENQE